MNILTIREPISHSRLCQNAFRPGGVLLDFLAKHPNIDPQILQLTTILWTPNGAQKLDICEDRVRVLHHECQEIELGYGSNGGCQRRMAYSLGTWLAPFHLESRSSSLHRAHAIGIARRVDDPAARYHRRARRRTAVLHNQRDLSLYDDGADSCVAGGVWRKGKRDRAIARARAPRRFES